ncbi:hypothetical protein COOONC_15424 [Cooperia oncophora]
MSYTEHCAALFATRAGVTPVDIVNIARWIHVPYKIAKTMMPAGFSDRFRLHDSNFLKALTEDIDVNYIPTTLGGSNEVK